MKLLTPVLLAVLATLSSAATISPQLYIQSNSAQTTSTDLIQVCGDASDLLTVKDITLHPDPPLKGETLTIDFKGELKEEVPEGTTVLVQVKYGVVQLLKKTFDFCQEVKKVDEKCPIPAGDLVFTKQVDLPKEIPPGHYSVHAVVTTPDDTQVTCLDGKINFPRK
ncbi:hypothetical protein LRAMOSA01324 [Lichtheimia ramosa]|uniref:Phosphatidylglycerol/phosphatidylinositol transfer protein n=1 Tax=Lichtheimia ramosa TaxID=688394 RepID=A0A077WJ42_9FUNG|nr:hypothetical protein LRAMOSA01324 [Lichtheimia ramosa]